MALFRSEWGCCKYCNRGVCFRVVKSPATVRENAGVFLRYYRKRELQRKCRYGKEGSRQRVCSTYNSFYSHAVMTWHALTNSSHVGAEDGPETTSELQQIQEKLCWEGNRHTCKHPACVSQNSNFKRRWRACKEHKLASKKDMFIALLSAVMQSDIPGSGLEVWGKTGTKHAVTDMSRCLQCGMRADRMWACVSVCMCMTA